MAGLCEWEQAPFHLEKVRVRLLARLAEEHFIQLSPQSSFNGCVHQAVSKTAVDSHAHWTPGSSLNSAVRVSQTLVGDDADRRLLRIGC